MNAAVFAYSRQGCVTARRVQACLKEAAPALYVTSRLAEEEGLVPIGKPSEEFYGSLFRRCDALIFIGSCGIAVREIAPHVRDKKTDPAVVVTDELGRFVIPLLSGHIGGANALAARLADALGAVPVITTATDINRRFSVDTWAARHDFVISSMDCAKAVSAAILEGPVPLHSDFPITGPLPPGVIPESTGSIGISISWRTDAPFGRTLRLIPRVLHLGIGCRKNTPAAAIARAVEQVLAEHRLDRRAFVCAASIDLKKDEPGLLEFCREAGLPVQFYSAETLSRLEYSFTPSEFVSKITGVDNVCERAAFLGARQLIVRKTICSGVTVAVAAENVEVNFG